MTCLTAMALAALLDLLDLLPSGFVVGESSLSGLTSVNSATIGVAVGAAISITTIPAAAYLGIAAGVGEAHRVPGALAVLGVNVTTLVAAGSATLVVQRRLAD